MGGDGGRQCGFQRRKYAIAVSANFRGLGGDGGSPDPSGSTNEATNETNETKRRCSSFPSANETIGHHLAGDGRMRGRRAVWKSTYSMNERGFRGEFKGVRQPDRPPRENAKSTEIPNVRISHPEAPQPQTWKEGTRTRTRTLQPDSLFALFHKHKQKNGSGDNTNVGPPLSPRDFSPSTWKRSRRQSSRDDDRRVRQSPY